MHLRNVLRHNFCLSLSLSCDSSRSNIAVEKLLAVQSINGQRIDRYIHERSETLAAFTEMNNSSIDAKNLLFEWPRQEDLLVSLLFLTSSKFAALKIASNWR